MALAAGTTAVLLYTLRQQRRALAAVVPMSTLLKQVEKGQVETAVVSASACAYKLHGTSGGTTYSCALLPSDGRLLVKLLHKHSVEFRAQGPASWKSALVLMLPFAYLGLCGWLLWRMSSDLGMNSARDADPAAAMDSGAAVDFEDVGGMPHVKAQVEEVVDFFHRPERYLSLGARQPRGILLAGPPGTGKTLLARAVAGTAGVPFLCCSGSDFVEVYVGRGSRRVRTLFEEAARRAPCVLFIDELDALGGRRSAGGHGSEEHEHTLNQLLAQMDGVGSSARILVIGATNRLAALDPALVRPGRFDRVLQLPLPDDVGRVQILQVHTRRTKLASPEDQIIKHVAHSTSGLSGAELANLVNEAAISAVRAGRQCVTHADFELALAQYKQSRVHAAQPSGASFEQALSLVAQAMGAPRSGTTIEEND